METNWLNNFVGHRVTALTGTTTDERSDTGTLIQIGDGWLQIAKDNGEMVLIPSSAIRVVKLLDMTRMAHTAGTDAAPLAPQIDPDAPLNNPALGRFPDGF